MNNIWDFAFQASYPVTVTGGKVWENNGIFDGSNHFEDSVGNVLEVSFSGAHQDFSVNGTIVYQTEEELEKDSWLD